MSIRGSNWAHAAAARLRTGLRTRKGKVLAVAAVAALLWGLASFTATHVTDRVLVSVDQARQVATVDGGVTIERSAMYFGTLSDETAARIQAILNGSHTGTGHTFCTRLPGIQGMREYQFWFSWHGIVTQYIQASNPGCVITPTTLGIPALWGIHDAPQPLQWADIDRALGLVPLPLQQ